MSNAEGRAPALPALGLLLGPIFYASSVVAIVPALRTTRRIVVVTALSLMAFAVEQAAGTFGGLYALLALAILDFLVKRPDGAASLAGQPADGSMHTVGLRAQLPQD
jgi:hypothetical protein